MIVVENSLKSGWVSRETFLMNGYHDVCFCFAVDANGIRFVMEVSKVESDIIIYSVVP